MPTTPMPCYPTMLQLIERESEVILFAFVLSIVTLFVTMMAEAYIAMFITSSFRRVTVSCFNPPEYGIVIVMFLVRVDYCCGLPSTVRPDCSIAVVVCSPVRVGAIRK